MVHRLITAGGVVTASILVGSVMAASEQDRFTLTSPNGIAFSACHRCHTRVKARDFVFSTYASR